MVRSLISGYKANNTARVDTLIPISSAKISRHRPISEDISGQFAIVFWTLFSPNKGGAQYSRGIVESDEIRVHHLNTKDMKR